MSEHVCMNILVSHSKQNYQQAIQ